MPGWRVDVFCWRFIPRPFFTPCFRYLSKMLLLFPNEITLISLLCFFCSRPLYSDAEKNEQYIKLLAAVLNGALFLEPLFEQFQRDREVRKRMVRIVCWLQVGILIRLVYF